uniref:Flavin-containing monooxygenase n=1 Tax=Chenopodium quinoa TaxID=63459 RepID=A0A803LI71_CHEQI
MSVQSSVYYSLRTNLPRVLMGFSDFGFDVRVYGDPRVFPGHQEVLAFLNDFATRFGIVELIRFNSEVVRVEPVGGRVDKWVVEWRRVENGGVKLEEEVFDAVVVCNGHCTVPRVANISGIEKWPGKQIHSHNYRVPEQFKDQVVVIIGNGASAYDISRDISAVAKEVHLSSRSPNAKFVKLDHCCNIWQHSAIYIAKENGTIEFEDGSSVEANSILHCTGYKYEFPFLNINGIVSVDDNRVGPLYKHVFPPALAPWLSFVGLPQKSSNDLLHDQILIFDMMELQSRWIARVLSRKVDLPSKEQMMADVQKYYQQMTILRRPKHLTHFLHNFEEYLDWLATQAETLSLEWRKEIYKETVKCLENREDGYRDDPGFTTSDEAAELKSVITGELPSGWEKALPTYTPESPGDATVINIMQTLACAGAPFPSIKGSTSHQEQARNAPTSAVYLGADEDPPMLQPCDVIPSQLEVENNTNLIKDPKSRKKPRGRPKGSRHETLAERI